MQRSSLVLATLLVGVRGWTRRRAGASTPPSRRSRSPSPARRRRRWTTPPAEALRIIGSQDAMPRSLFGDRDLLVISGGTSAGVQLGQQFFIRRTMTFGGNKISRGAKTLGWLRVVAVNESTAIGQRRSRLRRDRDRRLPRAVRRRRGAGRRRARRDARRSRTSPRSGTSSTGNEDRDMVGAGRFRADRLGPEPGADAGRALRDLSRRRCRRPAACQHRRRRRDLDQQRDGAHPRHPRARRRLQRRLHRAHGD